MCALQPSNGIRQRAVSVAVTTALVGVAAVQGQQTPTTQPAASLSYANTPDRYTPFGKFVEPYKRHFLEKIPFTGPGREKPEPTGLESVKLGFIGPIMKTVSVATGGASHEEPLGLMMLRGCQLAVEQANARGGYRSRNYPNGIPYELVIANDNGLWGASGNEIIKFAYTDKVWAILGTIDGANSHIAIRVALKAEVPMMNSADTDPTFIETNIPWVFRCIGDDRQQGYLLLDYVVGKLGIRRIAALRANNRYGRMHIDEIRDGCRRLGYPFVTELNYMIGDTDFTRQLRRIKSLKPEAVVTWGDGIESALIVKQMREMGMTQPFFGSDRMVCDEFLQVAGEAGEGVIAGYPWDPTRRDLKLESFRKAFEERFGQPPETYASHAYDGMNILIEAMREVGLNRARIRDYVADLGRYAGVTGEIIFDAALQDIGEVTLARVEKGKWSYYTREELGLPLKGL